MRESVFAKQLLHLFDLYGKLGAALGFKPLETDIIENLGLHAAFALRKIIYECTDHRSDDLTICACLSGRIGESEGGGCFDLLVYLFPAVTPMMTPAGGELPEFVRRGSRRLSLGES